ncbi:MAG TPA: hypothetical protein VFZ79_15035 [Acidimicrobiales bacterium]
MTCDPASPPRPRRLRRVLVATLAAAAVGAGSACATEADLSGPDLEVVGAGEFAATPAYLAAVADATDGLTYRMSMDMTMRFAAEGESFQAGGTFATGEVDGDLSSMTVDLGALFAEIADQIPPDEALPEGFLDGDLTMEMVTDGRTGYMRLPYFRTMAEMMLDAGASRSDLGPLADLAELGDTWGRIDLSEVSPSEVASAAGAQTSDPRAFLDMAALGTDVRELGTATIDSVEVRGLSATVTYGDMLEAQGVDADDLRDQMTSGAGVGDDEFSAAFEQTMEAVMAADMPIEVWVDGDDRVRRISLALNMTEVMAGAAEAAGEDIGDTGMSVDMVMDFTDYGDDAIQIEIPTDAVDITDEFLALMEGGGLDSGAGSPLGST